MRSRPTNILVIGSGAAGLRAAIAAHEAGTEVVKGSAVETSADKLLE